MFVPPILIAKSLHERAEKAEPQLVVDIRLPEKIHARFRQKVFLYREAIILLAILDRVRPPREGIRADPQFRPIFSECERIICGESTKSPNGAARRQSVKAAIVDLDALLHHQWGNRHDVAREWVGWWFADLGHREMNPEIVTRFSLFWFDEYTNVQNILEAAVQNGKLDELSRTLDELSRALKGTIGLP